MKAKFFAILIFFACLPAPAIATSPCNVEVVAFLGVDCPLAKLYSGVLDDLQDRYPMVSFKAVDSNEHDTEADIARFVHEHNFRVQFRKDVRHSLANLLGAERSPEVFLLEDGQVRYSGRIDDRYKPGQRAKAAPETCFLENAIAEVLSGRAVTIEKTDAVGCFIDRETELGQCGDPSLVKDSFPVTYADVAGIFYQKCSGCHRPGEVAPFTLLSYDDTYPWAKTIGEVVAEGRMPPWQVDPAYGHFANDLSLTAGEKRAILDWIECGTPAGDLTNIVVSAPIPGEGTIRDPDLVLTMQTPFQVPATGNIEYQEIVLDPHSTSDLWIQAIEIRPGNRTVVHHVNTMFRPAGTKGTYQSPDGDIDLASYVPGHAVTQFGPGIAKVVPAGWVIVLNIHYVTVGTPQEDQTSIAFKLIDAAEVTHVAATRKTNNFSFSIPANSKKSITASETLDRDYFLAALAPHMHLRGVGATFEVQYPCGKVETLLKTKYDFAWQHRYVLTTPKLLPAGTKLIFTGEFDNTADNPNNPNPNAVVKRGERTEDEMLHGLWDIYRPIDARHATPHVSLVPCLSVCAIGTLLVCRRRLALNPRN